MFVYPTSFSAYSAVSGESHPFPLCGLCGEYSLPVEIIHNGEILGLHKQFPEPCNGLDQSEIA
jgi:hypothetical protein